MKEELLARLSSPHISAVIAIDGLSGSGKSTLAHGVSKALSIPYLNSGLMYRAASYLSIAKGVLSNGEELLEVVRLSTIEVKDDLVTIDGNEITKDLRSPELHAILPLVASMPLIRRYLVSLQREWALRSGFCVIEGRDIGTVVFPDAFAKFFVTASDEERIRRRPEEGGGVIQRDVLDSSRADSPTVAASDALVLDSTEIGPDELVELVIAEVERRLGKL